MVNKTGIFTDSGKKGIKKIQLAAKIIVIVFLTSLTKTTIINEPEKQIGFC